MMDVERIVLIDPALKDLSAQRMYFQQRQETTQKIKDDLWLLNEGKYTEEEHIKMLKSETDLYRKHFYDTAYTELNWALRNRYDCVAKLLIKVTRPSFNCYRSLNHEKGDYDLIQYYRTADDALALNKIKECINKLEAEGMSPHEFKSLKSANTSHKPLAWK